MDKNIALVVDDIQLNRDILKEILNGDYDYLEASNGREALDIIDEVGESLSVIFLDIVMPEVNGIEVLENLNEKGFTKKLPIFIITSEGDYETESKCLNLGAFDFIKKPFGTDLIRNRVSNAVSLYSYKNSLEDKIRQQTEKILEQYEQLRLSSIKAQNRSDRLIEFLADLVEARDFDSGEHVKNVCNIVKMIAKELNRLYPEYGLTDRYIDMLGRVSMLHDIGKISIPDSILLKAGKLTDEEFEEMKKHTVYGEEILSRTRYLWDDDESLELSQAIARWHHERWDGKGYPDELVGDEIPIAAQIVSIADCFEALTADRVYRKALTKKKAISMIKSGKCGKFNPQLLRVLKEIEYKL